MQIAQLLNGRGALPSAVLQTHQEPCMLEQLSSLSPLWDKVTASFTRPVAQTLLGTGGGEVSVHKLSMFFSLYKTSEIK